MKIAVFCPVGIEDVLKQDIFEIIGKKAEQKKACCLVDCSEQELVKLAYLCQSAERIGPLIKQGVIKDECPTTIGIEDADLSHIKEKFSVNARIIGSMPFKSPDVVTQFSEQISERTDKTPLYKNADVTYYSYVIDEDYYLIIDVTNKELTKRDYKVFVNKVSLRGPLAYAVGKIADIKQEEVILDPFTRGGEIAMEVMHYFMKKSVHFYAKERFNFKPLGIEPDFNSIDKEIIPDPNVKLHATDSKMPNIKAAEKNAKIAGMNKLINFSRLTIEDLDLKFDGEVDKVLAHLPAVGQHTEKGVLKLYEAFFRICELILKDKATITCVGVKISPSVEIAQKHNIKLIEERDIMQGKEFLKLYKFEYQAKDEDEEDESDEEQDNDNDE